ncbi:branched-chain amino acid ABC transporter permease [Devosia sp.]|uniref:branched-chain amino acid ABC transporter permease n=1 Tax=Devosia sp. TaxID=1871048 RepID=UPI002F145D68
MEMFLQLILNGAVVGSTYAVVALGFTLAFTVLRVINFAHPEIFMIGMFGGLAVASYTDSLWLALLGGALVAGIAGIILERLIIRPLYNRDVLMTLIATLGVGIVLQNGMAVVVGPDAVSFPALLPRGGVEVGLLSLSYKQLFNFAVCISILGVISGYVRLTLWGKATQAVAERPGVAAVFGINVARISQVTIVAASALGGIAAVSVGTLYGTASAYVGVLYGLKSFVCMLVAGNRYFEGVIVVAFGLGILEALVTGYLSSGLRDAVAFSVLIGVLLLRPQGLFGSYTAKV